MSVPALLVFVRFQSRLSHDEVLRVVDERLPQFAALEGLEQKYYLHDPATGAFAGCYLWRSKADLDAYMQSELRRTIGAAYETEAPPRVEVYEMVKPLRP